MELQLGIAWEEPLPEKNALISSDNAILVARISLITSESTVAASALSTIDVSTSLMFFNLDLQGALLGRS